MGFGAQLGMQAAEQATGAILGMALGGLNDQRQLGQQGRLQRLQIRGQKEMTDYQMMKEMEMWNNTNYSAQIAHMKKAGLSPGLIYGKGGAGGAITGGAGQSVTGATAQQNPGEMGMGMQLQLLHAQKENIEADTNLKKTEAEYKGGVQTDVGKTQILDLTQGIQNKKAQEMLTQAQTTVTSLEAELKGKTLKDMADITAWTAGKALYEMEMAERETYIQKATMHSKIDQVKGEMLGTFIRNAMMAAQTDKTRKAIEVDQAQITRLIQQGVQEWSRLRQGQQGADTNSARQQQEAWLNDVQKSTQIPMDILKEAVDGILRKPNVSNRQNNYETNYY